MNTITLDRNALNGLFDNQKKLDDLFDSIFDDDNYFINSVPASVQSSAHYSEYNVESRVCYGSSKVLESFQTLKHSTFFYLLPIALEAAVIYLVMTKLL